MNTYERVVNVIERKHIDYIPNQISFTDPERKKIVAKALGLKEDGLDEYLNNCLMVTCSEDELPIFFHDLNDMMVDLEKKGYARVDLDNNIVYDRFGMGTLMHEDTFIVGYSPLEGDAEKDKMAAPFLPEKITKLFGFPLEEKIRKYEVPDGADEHVLDYMKKDYANYDNGEHYIFPTGYFGVYERAFSTMGWGQFMTEIAIRPNMIHELLEKVCEYKVQLAKKKVAETPSIVHHNGDDLGAQTHGLFSIKMFREMIKPYLKRLFDVYRDAGCHVCMHSCGYIMDYIPDLIEIGVDMLEPIQTCNDIGTLKKEYGKDIVFYGGIEVQELPFITPDGTREMTRNAIRTLGKGGGCIIGPSQYITNDVPVDNIVAMVETIMEERVSALK